MANNPPQRFGEYEVERQLGSGGFGKVYLARDTILDRQVALKVLHTDLAARPNLVKRFLREAKAMAKLKHDNIVTIYQLGNDPLHPPYIVMEFIEGSHLRKYLASRQGRLPLQEAIRILRPVAAALDAAHQQGMIHRDVKPANVLISSSGHVKLTDFGIVKMLQEDETTLTDENQRIGTPNYMAPEQADVKRKAEIGAASDIYSLAVMSYQMLTGYLPFTGNKNAVMFAHINTPPPHPHDFNPYLPHGVAGELLKALDKEPTKRHATASSFVNSLEETAFSQNESSIGATLPTSLPTDQPTNLPADQPSFGHSLPTEQLTNSPTDEPTSLRTYQLTDSPTNQPSFGRNPPPHQRPTLFRPWLPVVALLVAMLIVGGLFGYMISRGVGGAGSESPTVVATVKPAIEEPAATAVVVVPTVTHIPTDTPHPPTVTLIPTNTPIPPTNAPIPATQTPILATETPILATETPILATETPILATETPVPALVPGATRLAEDGMIQVYVPEGQFQMGASEDDEEADSNEKPQHPVNLNAYWIDQTEVTNEMYRACVEAGVCSRPKVNGSKTRDNYYDNPVYNNYPVTEVSWDDATAYCQWAGRRLPTEAEWEKAARGTDGRKYPWSDEAPTDGLANFNWNERDTTQVGSYSNGASPYGALDMAGNLWEWVNDWYDDNYYDDNYDDISPRDNPEGPSVETPYRIQRGGGWGSVARKLRVDHRSWQVASNRNNGQGFRCAVSDSLNSE